MDSAFQSHGTNTLSKGAPNEVSQVDEEAGQTKEEFKRGRVVVMEIGEQTQKGKWHVKLLRHKHFKLIQK